MPTAALTATAPASRSWTGRALSTLVVLFMIFDTVIHLTTPAPVTQAFQELQIPLRLSVGIGVVELVSTVLYAIPRTSFVGALLLTAYLGGATAIQLRAGGALFPILFPSILGVLMWGGLLLRNAELRGFVSESILGS